MCWSNTYDVSATNVRERILFAATDLFAQLGFNGASTRDIARLAAVNDATVYRHFSSKKNLFVTVLEAELQKLRVRADLQVEAANAEDLRSALCVIFALLTDALAGRPRLLRVLQFSGRAKDFLFLGRGIHYPIALEGALKLKEISYIHAEGYPAGEMKHGPNALIDENLPVVIVATRDVNSPQSTVRYEKTMSNLKEVKARSGIVIALATEGDKGITEEAEHVLFVPPAPEELSAFLEIVPVLLSYHIAVRRGCDVDQPRNLPKSVTVE
jgi:glutamine---fructose-6-phosphate transaminase (isomerizing)